MLTRSIANYLKKLYLIWNRDSVDDQLIFRQLREMSGGKLVVEEDFKLANTRDILIQNQTKKTNGKNNSKRKKRTKNKQQ